MTQRSKQKDFTVSTVSHGVMGVGVPEVHSYLARSLELLIAPGPPTVNFLPVCKRLPVRAVSSMNFRSLTV